MNSDLSRNRWKDFPFHPFIISAYAVLSLLGTNIAEVKPTVALRTLMILVVTTGILFVLLNALVRDRQKTSIFLTLTLALFYSYGHIYGYLEQNPVLGLFLGRHRYLVPVWILIFIILGRWVLGRKRTHRSLNRVMNLVSLVLIFLPLSQIALYQVQNLSVSSGKYGDIGSPTELGLSPGQTAPDVYYIILDAYARDDVLLEDFGIDNQGFLDELEQLGFYLAECSQSNYAQTQLSLASSLNLEYLENLGSAYIAGNSSRTGMDDLIHHSVVRNSLENIGYQTIAFETGFKYTQIEDADRYLSPRSGIWEKLNLIGGLNDFEVMFLRTTAGLILSDGIIVLPGILQPDFDNPRRIHRERVLFVFEQLVRLPEMEAPKFVFAHIVSPHPPYVLGPDGEFTNYDREETEGYRDQVMYLNKVILSLMDEILTKSATPPIIIIQSDHGAIGTPPVKRTKILNAYYFPGMSKSQLYPQVSPVNTFRLVFNHYFNGSYPLLEDISHFSGYKRPFDYTIISESRPGCEKN